MSQYSDEYYIALDHAKALHEQGGVYSGKFLRSHGQSIKDIIGKYQCESILDYGCGAGEQYIWLNKQGVTLERLWGIETVKYDPAVPKYSTEPVGKYDLVICSHVLGCIPITDLDEVIKHIYALTNKVLYVVENIGPESKAKKHPPVKCPKAWTAIDWVDRLSPLKPAAIVLSLVVRYRRAEGTILGRFTI